MAVVVVESPRLGALLVVDFERELASLISSCECRPVFLRAEIARLQRASLQTWQAVVLVKSIFPGALVTACVRPRKRRARRGWRHGNA